MIPSPANLITGPIATNVNNPVINTVNNGVKRLSKTDGTILCNAFSTLLIQDDAKTGSTVLDILL